MDDDDDDDRWDADRNCINGWVNLVHYSSVKSEWIRVEFIIQSFVIINYSFVSLLLLCFVADDWRLHEIVWREQSGVGCRPGHNRRCRIPRCVRRPLHPQAPSGTVLPFKHIYVAIYFFPLRRATRRCCCCYPAAIIYLKHHQQVSTAIVFIYACVILHLLLLLIEVAAAGNGLGGGDVAASFMIIFDPIEWRSICAR